MSTASHHTARSMGMLAVILVVGGCVDRSVSQGNDVSRPEAYGLVQPVTPTRQKAPAVITDPDQHLEYQRRTGDIPSAGR